MRTRGPVPPRCAESSNALMDFTMKTTYAASTPGVRWLAALAEQPRLPPAKEHHGLDALSQSGAERLGFRWWRVWLIETIHSPST